MMKLQHSVLTSSVILCFVVFEKGVSLFKFPHVFLIWMAYLRKFVERYSLKDGSHSKVERARELFEQAVVSTFLYFRHSRIMHVIARLSYCNNN